MDTLRTAVNYPLITASIPEFKVGHLSSPGETKRMWNSSNGTSEGTKEEILGNGGPLYNGHFHLPNDLYDAKGFGGRLHGVATIVRRDL